jgi:hypothetical protein
MRRAVGKVKAMAKKKRLTPFEKETRKSEAARNQPYFFEEMKPKPPRPVVKKAPWERTGRLNFGRMRNDGSLTRKRVEAHKRVARLIERFTRRFGRRPGLEGPLLRGYAWIRPTRDHGICRTLEDLGR